MHYHIDLISVLIWFFVLIPVVNYYWPNPSKYWPLILFLMLIISIYQSLTISRR